MNQAETTGETSHPNNPEKIIPPTGLATVLLFMRLSIASLRQPSHENSYPGMGLDAMMEYPGVARQRSCRASSFGADEWVENGPPCKGPEGWPEWKREDGQTCQRYLDDRLERDDDG